MLCLVCHNTGYVGCPEAWTRADTSQTVLWWAHVMPLMPILVQSLEQQADLASYDGLALRVKGDGQIFKLNIKTVRVHFGLCRCVPCFTCRRRAAVVRCTPCAGRPQPRLIATAL